MLKVVKVVGLVFFGLKFEYLAFLIQLTLERVINFFRKPLMMAVEISFEKGKKECHGSIQTNFIKSGTFFIRWV